MRFLALSDIHGSEKVLDFFRDEKQEYDCVLIAGDSANHSASFVSDLLEIFPDAYIIQGNNEHAEVLGAVKKARNYIHRKRIESENGMNLCGFGYSNPTPFGTPGELSEEEIEQGLNELRIDENTILLLHVPPFGILDEVKKDVHVGSKAIRRVIEEKQPFLVLCGHIHEIEGSENIGKTKVVKLGSAEHGKYCVLDVSEKEVKVEFKEMK
ncbi:metallophosphoesterase family protein [Candidatus Micrarchaeota archaeon]|nr:metallophosphoesterase family protein [Candidatus Micrarchaeota archaeon]